MNIFLATPISSMQEKMPFSAYKKKVKAFISVIGDDHKVISEIDSIAKEGKYEAPEVSVARDFHNIGRCEVFVIHYPYPMPTSALIELGYAMSLQKQIIILTPDIDTLPFLAKGIDVLGNGSQIVLCKTIGKTAAKKVETAILKETEQKTI